MNPTPASRPVPLTWDVELPPVPVAATRDRAFHLHEARGYLIALVAVGAAIVITRLTWPFFSRTPLFLLFAATFAAARWGNEAGSLLAIVGAAFGAGLAVPAGSTLVDESAFIMFVSGSLVANRFIIGRNRAEARLRASEAQFRAAWDNSAFGAALLNRRGLVERINPAMERTLGYPSAAWTGVSFGYFSHPEDQADERARFAAFIDGSEEWYHREQRYRRADGGTIWCRVTMSATSEVEGGGRIGALMVLEDVTRRRRAEDELRAWEARYQRLYEQVPIALFQCGVDGRLVSVNAAFLALLGHESIDTVRGAGIADFIGDRDTRLSLQDTLVRGSGVHELPTALRVKDGGRVSVILDMRPVRTTDGIVEYLDGSIRET